MINELIPRLDIWLRQNRTEYYRFLQKGLTELDLHEFEIQCGVSLPEDFKTFYRWRNGEVKAEGQTGVFGTDAYFLSISEIRSVQTRITEQESSRTVNELPSGLQKTEEYWNPFWIPVYLWSYTLYCLDMTGSYGYLPGQITTYRLQGPYFAYVEIPFPTFSALVCAVVQAFESSQDFEEDNSLFGGPLIDAQTELCAPGYPRYFPEDGETK